MVDLSFFSNDREKKSSLGFLLSVQDNRVTTVLHFPSTECYIRCRPPSLPAQTAAKSQPSIFSHTKKFDWPPFPSVKVKASLKGKTMYFTVNPKLYFLGINTDYTTKE